MIKPHRFELRCTKELYEIATILQRLEGDTTLSALLRHAVLDFARAAFKKTGNKDLGKLLTSIEKVAS